MAKTEVTVRMLRGELTDRLRNMEVGDVVSFPVEKLSVLRVMASVLGIQWNRVYSTRSDRARRVVEVTRME